MKLKKFFLLLPLALLAGCKDGHYLPEGNNINVILLMGQSNATGVALFSDLEANDPSTYSQFCSGFDNVSFSQQCENASAEGINKFHKLGKNKSYKAKQFGPELGIGKWMNEHSTKPTFIIKSSLGGSNLNNQWLNQFGGRGNLYNTALNYCKGKLKVLTKSNKKIDSLSVCWMQGESDNFYDYSLYEQNTKSLIKFLREDYKSYSSNISFIDAYISSTTRNSNGEVVWPNANLINAAKQRVADEDPLVATIKTNGEDQEALNLITKTEDPAHYDAVSQVALGEEFAKKIINFIGE